MDSVIFQANVLGMLAYIVPAMLLFFEMIKKVEDKLVERKLYIACGVGVVFGTIADIIMILGGIDLHSEDTGYAAMMLVTPFIMLIFMFIGVNLNTFKSEPAAPFYSAGFGLFFGGSVEFWKLLMTEERFPDLATGDLLLIAGFGLGTVLFFGGAGMWIAYGIVHGNGVRVAGRLAFLYLFLVFLNASALENIHYDVHDSVLVSVAALAGYFAIGATLFHQASLKLPSISEITRDDGKSKIS
ncbi:MAG: hypothetical protein MKZ83_00195 [Candidatus Poseidoniia archaeon]|nr:hypothetical protein [Candidatus Poseidoniia archaeon]